MSYPPPAYPQSPEASYNAPPKHLRGRIPLRLSIIFLVVGIVLAVVGGVIIGKKSLGAVDNFKRVSVSAGAGTVKFSHTGNYLAYYEAPGVNSDISTVPVPLIAFKSPSGKVRVLDTLYGGKTRQNGHIGTKLTYSYHGHHGVAIYQFKITEKGTYQVEVRATTGTAPDAKIAFGKSIAGGIALGAGLLVPGILLIIVGIILLIIGLVKRSRHKKQLQQQPYAGAGFPQGGGYPQGAPQGGGYPQGGYPQAGPPQPGYPAPGTPQPGYPQQPPAPPAGGWSPPPSS
jgi:hypothetical protein